MVLSLVLEEDMVLFFDIEVGDGGWFDIEIGYYGWSIIGVNMVDGQVKKQYMVVGLLME